MKYSIVDVLKQPTTVYNIHQWVVLFEQAEKAAEAIASGNQYSTPHYFPFLKDVKLSAKRFIGAKKHKEGFYYLIN